MNELREFSRASNPRTKTRVDRATGPGDECKATPIYLFFVSQLTLPQSFSAFNKEFAVMTDAGDEAFVSRIMGFISLARVRAKSVRCDAIDQRQCADN